MRKLTLSLVLIFVALHFVLAQTPTLGNYPSATVATAGGNVIINPSVAPANTITATVSATATFKGLLHINPASGKVSVTNAYPAGIYTITVHAFNGNATAKTAFQLTVNNTVCSLGLFPGNPNQSSGTGPRSVGVGDFNNDGLQDFVNTGGNTLFIRLGNGMGGFVTAPDVPSVGDPYSVSIADINGDGNQDIAVANYYLNSVSIKLGNGSGGFNNGSTFSVGNAPTALKTADFNGDGKFDIAVTNSGSNTVSVCIGNGLGSFSVTETITVGSIPLSIGIGDFNNDNRLDLAVGEYSSQAVSIFLGNGAGSFVNAPAINIGSSPNGVEITDFNGDGKSDLAVVTNAFIVAIRLGDGLGGFMGTLNVRVGTAPRAISTGDFNGDGQQDFATANQLDNSVSIRLGDGTGKFYGFAEVLSQSYPLALATADFNGDGRQDFSTGWYVAIGRNATAEVNILGNNNNIADAGNTPSVTDFTDFGNISTSLTRTYTIQNTGTANLTVSHIAISGVDSALFTVDNVTLPATIAPSSSTSFTVRFVPTSQGVKAARINITNDDCDEGLYDFAIQGNAVAVVPTIGAYPATVSASGGNTLVVPSAAPTNTVGTSAYTTTNFKGVLNINPATGSLRILNAHPAGTYVISVKAIHGFSAVITSFTLTVNNPVCGNPAAAVNNNVGSNPYSVAIGDFNNDGNQDFALANLSSGAASIRMGNGAGGFSGTTEVPTGTGQLSIVVGDFNLDGNQDFATCNSNSTVSIRLGDGSGGFAGSTAIPVGAGAFSITLGDFNGDGKPDFVTANATANSISIRFGDGAGNFSGSTEIAVGSKPNSVAAGDFDNNGKQDIAVANYSSGTVSILIGDGTGGFVATAAVAVIGGAKSLAIGDFNNDGKQDFVTANMPNNTVSVRMGNGLGGFSGNLNIGVTQYPNAIVTSDFNGDGKQDFATVNYSNSIVSIRFGDGTGNFYGHTNIAVGSTPYALAAGDFNADGRPDFLTANYSGNNVSVILGSANEINVQGNANTIADGDNVPETADNTQFGNAGNNVRTYTIQNTGLANLIINNIAFSGADSALFSASGIILPTTIAPDSSASFSVRFLPATTGIKTARVNIFNDDCDESIYDFAVQGTGILPILGTYSTTAIANAGGNTVANPSSAPINITGVTAYTSTSFKGLLQVDTATGRVIITNAHPTGTYTITVKAFNGLLTSTKTFTLTVNTTKCSQSLFYKNASAAVGGTPASIAVGDFNKDGNQDFAIANGGNGVAVRLGNGTGGLSGSDIIICGTGTQAVAVADFNNDGKQDFAVANNSNSSVSVRLGDGTGGFTGTTEVAVASHPVCIAIGDFNGDGRPDLATGSISSNSVSVRMGDGAGGFTGTLNLSSSCSTDILVADFNNDGKQDLAVTSASPTPSGFDYVYIFTGDGNGGFTRTGLMPVGDNPFSIALIDLNNDNNQDFVVANSSGDVSRAFGTGTGNFGVYTNLNAGSGYGLIETGDFNGDGKQDMVLGGGKIIVTRIAKGNAEFNIGGGFSNTTGPYSMAVGDFNNDGMQDMVVGGDTDSISLWLGGVNEIQVQGNQTTITAGDVTPNATDHTDFGNTGYSLNRTFTIRNPGTGTFFITGITLSGADSAEFTIDKDYIYTTVAAGDSLNIKVIFTPNTVGLKTTKVRISNDHCTKALYEFAIQGTGVIVVPTLGNYADTVIATSGGNINVRPSAPPTNASSIAAQAAAGFKGIVSVNPTTGVVTVTNAHPAGNYLITLKVNGLASASSSFRLTVGDNTCSQGLFTQPANPNVIDYPHTIAIGDFNNDGKQDFLASNYRNALVIRLGDGAGNFTIMPNQTTGTWSSGRPALVVTDFNGDGNQDVAVIIDGGNNNAAVLLGDGTGSFNRSLPLVMGPSPLSISTGDFNNDGKPDLVTTNRNQTITVRLGNGAGGFNPAASVPVGGNPQSIAVGDFNADGNQDFVVTNYDDSSVSVRLGNGSGVFTNSANVTVGPNPKSIVVADFNKDGQLDFATANASANTVSVRLGNGTGNFSGITEIAVGIRPEFIRAGDFNGDGKTDIATANYGSNSVSIRLGTGTGTFTRANNITVGAYPQSLALADFNADGRLDIITANYGYDSYTSNTGSVSILSGNENEINIQGNSISIADNSVVPDLGNFTDFGNVSSSHQRTFIIQNTGLTSLTISNIRFTGADSSSFTLANFTLPTAIAAGASASFTVTFVPATAGLKTATIHIDNDDCNEALYDFALQGTGVVVVSLLGNYPATTIATAGGNTAVIPTSAPVNAVNISAYSTIDFKGILHINPVTGILTVTNAHPAGSYTVTVKAHGVSTATASFTLTVNDPKCSLGQFVAANAVHVNPYFDGLNPISIAVADFNNDGNQDIASANAGSNSVAVRIKNGAGYFVGNTNVAVGTTPYSLTIGDFNGDGHQDFITANYGSNNVSVRLGDGAGAFSGTTAIDVGANPASLAIADFNNDGKTDFVTANEGSSTVSVRLGNGAGDFSGTVTVPVGIKPMSVATGDFNLDGNIDFATANSVSNTVSVRLGNGMGQFTGTTELVTGNSPGSITTGDFNKDGKADIATANYTGNTISVFLGDGAGGFVASSTIPVGTAPVAIAIGDFNGDNKQDLITANNGNSTVSIRLGDGAGGFTGTANRALGNSPRSIVVGEFDKNGIQDFGITCYTNETLYIYLGSDKEIVVKANGVTIDDGDTTPAVTDSTDFQNITIGSSRTRTFTIQNTGSFNLTISNITLTGADSLSFIKAGITLPAIITPGASATFTVRFSPTGTGVKNGRINIFSDDCDESMYDFAIRGVAACLPSSTNNVWLGNTADWNLPGNWSLNAVPSECSKVVVNAGVSFMPQISTQASCYSLTLNNGATFTVTGTGHLTITGP